MSIVHISEEEAAKNLGMLVAKVAEGNEFVIDGPASSAKLVSSIAFAPRSGAEILARMANRAAPHGIMDADFADDVRSFRERHPELDFAIATTNLKHFEDIPGLRIANPVSRP